MSAKLPPIERIEVPNPPRTFGLGFDETILIIIVVLMIFGGFMMYSRDIDWKCEKAQDDMAELTKYYSAHPERLGSVGDYLNEICKDDEKAQKSEPL